MVPSSQRTCARFSIPVSAGLAVFLVSCVVPLQGVQAQTLKISSTLSVEKDDSKEKTHESVSKVAKFAREHKLESNVVRFLENTMQQTAKMLEAVKVVEEQKSKEVPAEFTATKYKVKPITKLKTKKITVKKIAATELRKKFAEGKGIDLKEPLLVTNTTALFKDGSWDNVRRHWHSTRIASDDYLQEHLRIEYWPPEKARARLVGNMLVEEDPQLLEFQKFLTVCFHGTPAKPKLPGQNTEHCEFSMDANSMVRNASELDELRLFPEIKNALPVLAGFRTRLLQVAGSELNTIIGKTAERWKKEYGNIYYQYFTFGPSGSGDKLHAENGLPFFDVLIHGSRRWLLLKEEEMERVAVKAREALEFDKTSAYMFFEEKLPELVEEFGLKKYVECNQQAGDLVFVPSGWYRVSLSLADSISYYETILNDEKHLSSFTDSVWRPQFRQYDLAYCYDAHEVEQLPNVKKDSQLHKWLKGAVQQMSHKEATAGILKVLFVCGSTMALKQDLPEFAKSTTVCTPEVWTRCRKQLKGMLDQKKVSASLDWLPKKAPQSVSDLHDLVAAKSEL
eukprot:TRINITY_DN4429_c0_g1_i1.p1 TRINITY_DN4429_c0_g1~~TRINITY_DN4429_c0_g1_i1.p1  ORF type:complete len:565 (+),score=104.43 TRINITY_DN4429_c0_g1_i1:110-1804(+)